MSSPKSSPLRFRPTKKAEPAESFREAKHQGEPSDLSFPSSPTMNLPTCAKLDSPPAESNSRIPVLPTSPKSKLGFGFLSRTRKKSQNAPLPPAPPPSDPRRSMGGLDTNRASTHADHPVLDISPLDPSASSGGAGPTPAENIKPVAAHSFGSKLARFSPLRPRRAQRDSEDNFSPTALPVPEPSTNYYDSISSSSSSGPPPPTTPKPLPQPTITVSTYPDSSLVEEYREIFTYAPVRREVPVKSSQTPVPAANSQRQRALSTKSAEHTRDYRNTSTRSEQPSRRSEDPDSVPSKRRTLGAISITSHNANGGSGPTRSGSIRSMASQYSLPDSPPPPIPLPPPPTSPTHHSTPSHATHPVPDIPRPRANTLSGLHAGPPPVPTTSIRKVASSPLEKLLRENPISKVNLEKASKDELRNIIQVENSRLEELASYIVTMVDLHSAEKTALERRIAMLESEAKKKEKEMKGLRWIMTNDASAVSAHGSSLEPSVSSRASSNRRSRASSGSQSRIPSSMLGSDSESLSRTSGFDTSTTTDSNTFYAKRRKRQPVTHSRSGSNNGLGLDINGANIPYLVPTSNRSSVASMASPSSSTSSLGLPISTAALSPGLSAIPEGPPTPQSQLDNTPMLQNQRTLPTVSVSSPETPNDQEQIAASAAYSANLKRDRHTSIEQVLEQSVNMDSALQKLRRFNTNASTPSF
jgi:hypothetical protein